MKLKRLTTVEECGMFVVAIRGEDGVDLCCQGNTREEALERLAMQAALELAYMNRQYNQVKYGRPVPG